MGRHTAGYAARIALVMTAVCDRPMAQIDDPRPFAAIACPLPDTLDQLYRDSATIRLGRLRVNQAGYVPADTVWFYGVGLVDPAWYAVDLAAGDTVAHGSMRDRGISLSSQIRIRASNNAQIVPGGDTRYVMRSPEVSGRLLEKTLPGLPPGRYRIESGSHRSPPFVVDSAVYGWVRDAMLQFYGINRCRDSHSWFHPPCHLRDPVPGGWHDCGDHLKEAPSPPGPSRPRASTVRAPTRLPTATTARSTMS